MQYGERVLELVGTELLQARRDDGCQSNSVLVLFTGMYVIRSLEYILLRRGLSMYVITFKWQESTFTNHNVFSHRRTTSKCCDCKFELANSEPSSTQAGYAHFLSRPAHSAFSFAFNWAGSDKNCLDPYVRSWTGSLAFCLEDRVDVYHRSYLGRDAVKGTSSTPSTTPSEMAGMAWPCPYSLSLVSSSPDGR
jgi:hypothetical protein